MGDLDALAGAREQHRVLADDVAAADGGEADGAPVALARVPLAAVDGALAEVAAEGLGDDLAQPQGSARGGVDLVAVVRLDDLDVAVVAQHARGDLHQLEAQVDAGAHVGGEDHGDVAGGLGDTAALGLVEPRGADDDAPPELAAQRHVPHGGVGRGEVDEHVEALGDRPEVVGHRHVHAPEAGELARVVAHPRAARTLEGGRQHRVLALGAGLDDGPPHAPGRPRHGDTHAHRFPLSASRRAGALSARRPSSARRSA